MAGKLYYVYGSMASSKSAQLLMNAHSFEERGIPFLCIKSMIDDRDGQNVIKSRIGISRECITVEPNDDIVAFMTDFIMNVRLHGIEKPRWILVDECQFLTEKQVDQLAEIVDDMDINVMCYGLRTDFRTRAFEGSRRLMEIADDITELKVSCSCGRKAIVNARVDGDGNVVVEGEQIEIGGDDRYVSLCRKCYNDRLKAQGHKDAGEVERKIIV